MCTSLAADRQRATRDKRGKRATPQQQADAQRRRELFTQVGRQRRVPKLTPALQAEIVDAVKAGSPVMTAAGAAGVTKQTLAS
jgi:hypothetical protein